MTPSSTHPLHHEASEKLFERSRAVIPGGVNSPVRAFNSVGGTPAFAAKAKGAYLYDADGNEYVDLVCSWGPSILGHAHPQVVEAVQQAAERGLSLVRRARRRLSWLSWWSTVLTRQFPARLIRCVWCPPVLKRL